MSRRLLVVNDGDTVGGAEVLLGGLVDQLREHWEITAMAHDADVLAAISHGLPSDRAVAIPALRHKHDLRHGPAVFAALRRTQPDVVLLNKSEPAGLRYLHLLCWLQRLPVVSIIHSLLAPTSRPATAVMQLLGRRGGAVVTVALRSATALDRLLGLAPGTTHVIEPAITPPSEARARRPSGEVTTGVLARLTPEKRVDAVIDIVNDVPDVRLVVGGTGPDHGRLEQMIASRGLGDRVRFTGWTHPDRFFADVDVLVSASELENAPLSILEAQARGVPVVARTAGGVADLISDGHDGLLADDDEELADGVRRFVTDRELRERVIRGAGETAKRRGRDNDPRTMAAAYHQLLERESA